MPDDAPPGGAEVPTSTSSTSPPSGATLSTEQIQQLINLLNNSKASNNVHTHMGEAQNDQDRGDESPHADGTESSDDISLDSGATHNVDGTESLNSESGATLDELVTTFPIDHNIVESNSTSEGNGSNNGSNIPNVDPEPITQRRSGRASKLPAKLSDFVLDGKVKYGIDKVVNYSKLSTDNYCFSTNLNKSFEPNTFHEACQSMNEINQLLINMDERMTAFSLFQVFATKEFPRLNGTDPNTHVANGAMNQGVPQGQVAILKTRPNYSPYSGSRFQLNTVTPRPQAQIATKPPLLALPAPPKTGNTYPVRRQLTQKELEEKRAKNQCFYCDQRYTLATSAVGKYIIGWRNIAAKNVHPLLAQKVSKEIVFHSPKVKLGVGKSNRLLSASCMMVAARDLTYVTCEGAILGQRSDVLKNWCLLNISLSVFGANVSVSICSVRNASFFSSICSILKKHNLDGLSTSIHSDHAKTMCLMNLCVNAPIEIAHIFPYEDLFKITMDEINYAYRQILEAPELDNIM
ncbi:hypothetical protein CTI12_AA386370 [Artemisia annua]|uniref:Uncharacterized protein n=1 Tax=Artemisia annua TaxID=35608 RepID=A0A2U1MFF1_ARTAN|nr:hypothetical protein CTI12_AA386370 [Artemisia annua]